MLTDYWSDTQKADEWLTVPANKFLDYKKNYYFSMDGSCMDGGSDSITLYGKSLQIQDAMDNFQTILEPYERLSGDVVYVPDRISVFQNGESDFDVMTLHATMIYDGVRVDDADICEQPIKDYGDLCRLSARAEQMEFGNGKYPYWTCMDIAYVPEKKMETYTEVLPFDAAWTYLQKQVATEEKVLINRADLMYSIWYQPTSDTDKDWRAQMNEPPEMYATPVWRFVSYQNAQESYAYYVDAITGEVTAYEHAVFN